MEYENLKILSNIFIIHKQKFSLFNKLLIKKY